jgi:hypothetical protein
MVALSLVVAAFFFTAVLASLLKGMDGLPIGDMWQGYAGFWYRLQDHGVATWFELHNEHRLVVSRLLFWADLAWFGGNQTLVFAGVLFAWIALLATLSRALVHVLHEAAKQGPTRDITLVLISVIVVMMSSTIQLENLTVSFQVQIILATVLPLGTLLCLARSVMLTTVESRKSLVWFSISLVLTGAAVLNFASGVLVPFFALAFLLLSRSSWTRCLAFGLLSCVAVTLQLVTASGGSASVVSSLSNPLGIAAYLVMHLGAPLYWLTGGPILFPNLSAALAAVGGAVVLALIGTWLILERRELRSKPMAAAVLTFVVFVIAVGIVVGAGRFSVSEGIEQSLSGRYQTWVLALWASLVILYSPYLVRMSIRRPFALAVLVLCVFAMFIPFQLRALGSVTFTEDARRTTALAVALGVPDATVLAETYSAPETAIPTGVRLAHDGLTLLGSSDYRDLLKRVDTLSELQPKKGGCDVVMISFAQVPQTRWSRVWGSLALTGQAEAVPVLAPIVDQEGRIRGYAQTGLVRGDANRTLLPPTERSGFLGYLHNRQEPEDLYLWVGDRFCPLAA